MQMSKKKNQTEPVIQNSYTTIQRPNRDNI